jgi:hypothetical protein
MYNIYVIVPNTLYSGGDSNPRCRDKDEDLNIKPPVKRYTYLWLASLSTLCTYLNHQLHRYIRIPKFKSTNVWCNSEGHRFKEGYFRCLYVSHLGVYLHIILVMFFLFWNIFFSFQKTKKPFQSCSGKTFQ